MPLAARDGITSVLKTFEKHEFRHKEAELRRAWARTRVIRACSSVHGRPLPSIGVDVEVETHFPSERGGMVRGAGPSGAVSCPLHVNPESDVCFPSHTLSDVPGGARWLPHDHAGRGAGPRIRLTPLLVSLQFAFQRQGGRERRGRAGREERQQQPRQGLCPWC